MRQDKRDCLRMFAFQILGELLRIGLLQRIEFARAHFGGVCDVLQELSRAIFAESLDQQLFRIFGPALRQVVLRECQLVIFIEDCDGCLR